MPFKILLWDDLKFVIRVKIWATKKYLVKSVKQH